MITMYEESYKRVQYNNITDKSDEFVVSIINNWYEYFDEWYELDRLADVLSDILMCNAR